MSGTLYQVTGGTGNDLLEAGTAAPGSYFDGGEGSDILVSGRIGYNDGPANLSNLLLTSVEVLDIWSAVAGITGEQFQQFSSIGSHYGSLVIYTPGGFDLGKVQFGVRVTTSPGDDTIIGNPLGTGATPPGLNAAEVNAGAGNDLLYGSAGIDWMDGAAGNDTTYGYGGADSLAGGGGNDLIYGGDGNDVIVGAEWAAGLGAYEGGGNDTLHGEAGNDLLQAAGAKAALFGGGDNDTLLGSLVGDLLDGGTGADSMVGGIGNDTYAVEDAGDLVVESATNVYNGYQFNGGARDLVRSSIAYTLPTAVEALELQGTADLAGTGNALANQIFGNAGNNLLQGLEGNDRLFGGGLAGTNLLVNGGFESYGAFTSLEDGRIIRTGDVTGWTLAGPATVDLLTFGASGGGRVRPAEEGLLFLDGGSPGPDYALSQVVGGLVAGATYVLALEHMAYSNGINFDILFGGVLLQRTNQNEANIDDWSSYDSGNTSTFFLTGGLGDGSNRLELREVNGSTGRFGVDDVRIYAMDGVGADTLDGGAGDDTAAGGLGDDVYLLDSAGDVVLEGAGQGTDTVVTSLAYVLGNNLENLQLSGTGNVKGTGNALANVIVGNAGRNLLVGLDGGDSLDGGGGNDVLVGGKGADTLSGGLKNDVFRYGARAEGGDTIIDFGVGDDVFQISARFGDGLVAGMDIGATGRFVANATGVATMATGQFVLNTTTAELWFDANGTAAGQRTLIATLNTTAITAADIVII